MRGHGVKGTGTRYGDTMKLTGRGRPKRRKRRKDLYSEHLVFFLQGIPGKVVSMGNFDAKRGKAQCCP